MRVFSLSKEYESWTAAVESMRGQGILFLNPMSSFELSKKENSVSLSLVWFDNARESLFADLTG